MEFGTYVDSMNCAMLDGMTVQYGGETTATSDQGVEYNNDAVLFMRQMIPHHQNAVNMAKAAMTLGTFDCDTTGTVAEGVSQASACVLSPIMMSIINVQNKQIQTMLDVLDNLGVDSVKRDCDIQFEESSDDGFFDFFESLCSPGNMEVDVQGKGAVRMDELQVGDYVKVGNGESYEPVYAFGHRVPDKLTEFVQLHTNAGIPLEMTSEHLVFVDGKTNPVRADSIQVGDILHAEGNNNAVVNKIEVVTKRGIYNPLTRSGTIQVNGITASNYISLQNENNEYVEFQGGVEITSHHDAAHLAVTPYRFYCTTLAICDTNDANSGMPFYVSKLIELMKWSKQQNFYVQLFVYASFRMLLLASMLMACAVFMIPVYPISGEVVHQLQDMVSFESKSVVHFNKETKKEN